MRKTLMMHFFMLAVLMVSNFCNYCGAARGCYWQPIKDTGGSPDDYLTSSDKLMTCPRCSYTTTASLDFITHLKQHEVEQLVAEQSVITIVKQR